jgi:hypothetical protein
MGGGLCLCALSLYKMSALFYSTLVGAISAKYTHLCSVTVFSRFPLVHILVHVPLCSLDHVARFQSKNKLFVTVLGSGINAQFCNSIMWFIFLPAENNKHSELHDCMKVSTYIHGWLIMNADFISITNHNLLGSWGYEETQTRMFVYLGPMSRVYWYQQPYLLQPDVIEASITSATTLYLYVVCIYGAICIQIKLTFQT